METFIDCQIFGTSSQGVSAVLRICVHVPVKDDLDYMCAVEISGIDDLIYVPSSGVDPIQALIMAVHVVYIHVRDYEMNGWRLFLAGDKSEASRYEASGVWRMAISRLFTDSESKNSEKYK
jgi:hypothetical protein